MMPALANRNSVGRRVKKEAALKLARARAASFSDHGGSLMRTASHILPRCGGRWHHKEPPRGNPGRRGGMRIIRQPATTRPPPSSYCGAMDGASALPLGLAARQPQALYAPQCPRPTLGGVPDASHAHMVPAVWRRIGPCRLRCGRTRPGSRTRTLVLLPPVSLPLSRRDPLPTSRCERGAYATGDMLLQLVIAKMRDEGCGEHAMRVALLAGIGGARSRQVRRIVLIDG